MKKNIEQRCNIYLIKIEQKARLQELLNLVEWRINNEPSPKGIYEKSSKQ